MTDPKKLITLEEHNKIATQINHTGGNGISCPNCGSELFDSTNSVVLTSNPPQYLIFCRECNYKGTRF
jgi:C4-type Zn-finger protein